MKESGESMKKKMRISLMTLLGIISVWMVFNPVKLGFAEEVSSGMNVRYRTADEIRNFIKEHPAKVDDPVVYLYPTNGSYPYGIGVLNQETLNSAINFTNQIRFIAGLSSDVQLNQEYNQYAQFASMVNYVNQEMSHYPKKPELMDFYAYHYGFEGASKSNLGRGYGGINSSILRGYMSDSDLSNINRVGHRRWVLNPSMSATGFGYFYDEKLNHRPMTAMYAMDRKNTYANEFGVAWPAQTMPLEYFFANDAWSVSLGYFLPYEKVKVKLTRQKTQEVWNFSTTHADGYFNVENSYYGQQGAIIFRPDHLEDIQEKEVFLVEIEGTNQPIRYQVTFFALIPLESVKIEHDEIKLTREKDLLLKYSYLPQDATNVALDWEIDDENIALLRSRGIGKMGLHAKNLGETWVTLKNTQSPIQQKKKVVVVPEQEYLTDVSFTAKTKKTNQMAVKFKKVKGATGYELLYTTNAKTAKQQKIVQTGDKNYKFVLKKINPKLKYTVKARAYVTINGKKWYGNYSQPVQITISKTNDVMLKWL